MRLFGWIRGGWVGGGQVGGKSRVAPGPAASGGAPPPPSDVVAVETLVQAPATEPRTVVPTPRPHPWSDELHARQMAAFAAASDLDLLLIGDSIAQDWPLDLWAPWRSLSLGIGGLGTQHVLGRLRDLNWAACRPARALMVVGTNNLLAGDPAADIAAGIGAIAAALAQSCPAALAYILLPPPLRFEGRDYAGERGALRGLLSARFGGRLIDADAALAAGGAADPKYEPDRIHFTRRGYETLTRTALAAMGAR